MPQPSSGTAGGRLSPLVMAGLDPAIITGAAVPPLVMAGLDPAIIMGAAAEEDATVKPWHDEVVEVPPLVMAGFDPAVFLACDESRPLA
jgi:hypothetical protein